MGELGIPALFLTLAVLAISLRNVYDFIQEVSFPPCLIKDFSSLNYSHLYQEISYG